jgi:hypothetical protein
MTQEAIPEETITARPLTDQEHRNLFESKSNDEVFKEILSEPGNTGVAELTAAYFLRPIYINGAAPPETLPADHPLAEKLESLDLETITDPREKHVFAVLRGAIKQKREFPEIGEMVDESLLAAALVPGIIERHGPMTSPDMLEHFQSTTRYDRTAYGIIVHEEVLSAVGLTVSQTEIHSEEDAFSCLALANKAALVGKIFADEMTESVKPPESALIELRTISSALQQEATEIMSTNFGMSDQVIENCTKLMQDPEAAYHALKGARDFERFTESLEDPTTSDLLIRIAPQFNTKYTNFVTDLIKRIIAEPEFSQDGHLLKLAEALDSEEAKEVTKRLSASSLDQTMLRQIFDEKNPSILIKTVLGLINDKNFKTIFGQELDAAPHDPSKHTRIPDQVLYDPLRLKGLIDAIADSPKLSKVFENPSVALPSFILGIMNSAEVDSTSLAIRGGTGIIWDAYSQASKLSDPLLIQHYVERVSSFQFNISTICRDPEVRQSYEMFLDKNPTLSAKQEERAARIFRNLNMYGSVQISETDSLDDIESRVIENFISKIIGDNEPLDKDATAKLLEKFGGVGPLLAYAHKFIDDPEYKKALAGLTKSVADDSYSEWRRGNGSEEALKEMIDAGYLPEGLTLEQYQDWISDGQTSTETELISSAEDTAQAIREAVALGSIDIDLLATGYTVDASSLTDIIASRNGLGRLTGTLHKAIGRAKGQPLGPEAIEEIVGNLGEINNSREVMNLIGLLRDGTETEQVLTYLKNTREHLEQLRLIIRVANITAEEVASGSLLSDPDENGKRKAQETLQSVLSELQTELPEELRFIPNSVFALLEDHAKENGQPEVFIAEDTIDPKVTIEIGETPQRSCQHYANGSYNQGLIGYFGPEVKIMIVRNEKGGIIGRSITRLMQDENGQPVIYTEPVYKSVTSPQVTEIMQSHIREKAQKMGVSIFGALGSAGETPRELKVRTLKMPAVYTDSGGGVRSGSLTISSK